ncbi:hypothetical protein ABFX02_06G177600 [Erythranthe guttata]
MEQGFPENSALASSEQNELPYFDESNINSELGQIMNILPQRSSNQIEADFRYQPSILELGGSSQIQQAEDGSLFGQLQEESYSRNEDLFTVYMKGIAYTREQRRLQENQEAGNPNNVAMHNVPNLPIEGQLIGSSSISVPFEIGNNLVPNWEAQAYSAAINMEGSSLPSRLDGNNQENIPSPIINSPNIVFNEEDDSSYQNQAATHSRQKRKMLCYEENAPVRRRRSRFGQGDQGQSSSLHATTEERYTIYDKRYEEIGLPMDPHLRIFNATKGNGREGRST